MMVTLASASACSSSSSSSFLASAPNCGTKIGGGTKTKHRRRIIEAKIHYASSSCSGGLRVKANATINSSQVLAKSTTTFKDEEGLVFRQKFSVRSYEVDANRTTSVETLLNYFQESAINHFKRAGLHREGFGSTEEMIKRNLIWVFTQMQVVAYRYPTWGDEVEVETWFSESGKNSVRWNWLLRDFKTNQVLTRASSVCVMMNKLTRRLSKIPEEARREFESYFVNSAQILEDDDTTKLPKLDHNTAHYIHTGLTPRWSDLDVNLHVNNVKYIGWILESVPRSILLNLELSTMRLEYRRECGEDSKLQSLTSLVSSGGIGDNLGQTGRIVEFNHLLRLEDGAEIVRGKTEWRPKFAINFDIEANHPPHY